jgi:hypothetical protein
MAEHGTARTAFLGSEAEELLEVLVGDDVAVTARAGRAMHGAICGRARAGERALLARLVRRRRPELFAGQVTCFDRISRPHLNRTT